METLSFLKAFCKGVDKLIDEGWKHLFVIKTVDSLRDNNDNLTRVSISDVIGRTITVDPSLYEEDKFKPGNAFLFKGEINDTLTDCGFLTAEEVIEMFSTDFGVAR